jgi:hypothetical protein
MSFPSRPAVVAFAACLLLASASLPAAELVEYYHKDLDHYFVTSYAPEIEALDTGVQKGWARTGLTIQTVEGTSGAGADSIAVCRFYGNPARGLDSHFYSNSKKECEDVKQKWPEDWLLETEEAFRVHAVDPSTGACPANTKAVYRLYNKRPDVNHRYTTDPAVFDSMIAKGYAAEGSGNPQKPVVFCASSQGPAQPAAGAPVCAVTASTAFPVPNTPVTLTATCSETPTTYAWINCTSTGATCAANATAVGAVNYGVIATNSRGSSAPASITLNWALAASAGPTCAITASNATPTLGTAVTLTSSCSQSPTKYQWLACSALLIDACNAVSECANRTTSCSPVSTQAGPIYYALVATNSAGASQKAGINVDWRTGGSSSPPPPPNNPTPYCTISPNSGSPAVNTTLTLTASCTNSPTSYQWQNCASVAGSPHQCTTTESLPVTRIYRVQGVNTSGVGVPSDLNVTWQSPPTAPPVCTLAASSPTPYLGGSLTLTASCTQSPTSYTWTGCNSSGSTCQASASAVGPASYSVRATNSFGPGASAPVNVTWTNPPPSGADFCGQYANVVRVDLPWGGLLDTYQNGGFPGGAVLVGRIRVPQNATGTSVPGLVSVVEYVDPQARRVLSFSPSACDFRGFTPGVGGTVDPSGSRNPMAWSFGINPNVLFGMVGMPGGGVRLIPGQTYYVNIRNVDFDTGGNSCQGSTCNVRMTVNRPR